MTELKLYSSESMRREDILRDDPFRDFHVSWDDITKADVKGLSNVLERARDERPLQRHLGKNPMLLAQCVGGGHGRWVIPQKRLGAEFVTDFIVGERSSIGFEWLAVELESPRARLFAKDGDPRKALTHALRQVTDWRSWLQNNQNYAARARGENGLGLTDIVANIPSLIIIGRRAETSESTKARRAQMSRDLGIKIHTYDWLVDLARERVRAMAEVDRKLSSRAEHSRGKPRRKRR